jgi:hypothetical protein
LALSSIGFGAITAFIALLFANRGWSPAWLAFSAFAIAFIMARTAFGHRPDRLGGARVALVSMLIEAAGQALIWLTPGAALALFGTVLTNPRLLARLPWPRDRSSASRTAGKPRPCHGIYTAFLDLALRLASPALGLVASGAGMGAVFLVSTLIVLGVAAIAVRLLNMPTVT